jgi:hypothetical protein
VRRKGWWAVHAAVAALTVGAGFATGKIGGSASQMAGWCAAAVVGQLGANVLAGRNSESGASAGSASTAGGSGAAAATATATAPPASAAAPQTTGPAGLPPSSRRKRWWVSAVGAILVLGAGAWIALPLTTRSPASFGTGFGPPLQAGIGPVNALAFSPDGHTLVAGGGDSHGEARLWNTADAAHPIALCPAEAAGSGAVTAVAFSPDGRTVAIADADGTVLLWDVSGPRAPTATGPPRNAGIGAITALAFSPREQLLAIAGQKGLQVWNVADPEHPVPLREPLAAAAGAVAFSPDGRTLAAGTGPGTVALWDTTESGTFASRINLTDLQTAVTSLAFDASSSQLAAGAGNGDLAVWHGASADWRNHGSARRSNVGAVRALAFSPDARALLVGGEPGGTIRLSDPAKATQPPSGYPSSLPGHTAAVQALSSNPRTRVLASGSGDGTIRLWHEN